MSGPSPEQVRGWGLICSVCGRPIVVGDEITIACVAYADGGEPILNYTHERCVEAELEVLRFGLDLGRWP